MKRIKKKDKLDLLAEKMGQSNRKILDNHIHIIKIYSGRRTRRRS